MSPPELSVVLASAAGETPAIEAALAGLRQACAGINSELIVVSAGASPPSERLATGFGDLRIDSWPSGTLMPVLWGAGLRLARGKNVAFTTDQLRVGPSWARSLLRGLESDAAGAGGPIILKPAADAVTTAAYLIRFSGFTPRAWAAPARARDIPGDNAAYRRDALFRHPDLLSRGFWEVEFHRRFEREGRFLQMVPDASATLVDAAPFGALLRQRYRHARHYGGTRVRERHESPLKLLLSAPLVPLVLLARIGRRAWPGSRERIGFLRTLPWLLPLAAAWAVGEAHGAVTARRGAAVA